MDDVLLFKNGLIFSFYSIFCITAIPPKITCRNYKDDIIIEMAEESIDIAALRSPVSVCDLGKDFVALHHVFGADITRRNNIALIENHRIVYALGNVVVFEDILTGDKEYLLSIDEGGVGCVAVHPSRYLRILLHQTFLIALQGNILLLDAKEFSQMFMFIIIHP
jgi:hypothetical protein